MFDVITVGSAVRDMFARTQDILIKQDRKFPSGEAACFALGSKLDVDDLHFSVGGGAINTAVTFAEQGLKVAAVAAVGDDPEGAHIREVSAHFGIHCDFLSVDAEHATSLSFIVSLPDGSRTVFRHKGASWHMQEHQVPWTDLRCKWLYVNHLGGDSTHLLPRLFEHAQQSGARIVWNPGSTQLADAASCIPLLQYVDILIVNQEEASQLVGIPYQKKKQIFKKLDALVHGVVVMTKGKKGVDVSDGKTLWSAGVLPMKDIVDRTGAGDAFGSGFVAALSVRPNNIEHAIQLASANATGVLTAWGAHHGLLKKTDAPILYGTLPIKKTTL